jgi:hypothetical protein
MRIAAHSAEPFNISFPHPAARGKIRGVDAAPAGRQAGLAAFRASGKVPLLGKTAGQAARCRFHARPAGV